MDDSIIDGAHARAMNNLEGKSAAFIKAYQGARGNGWGPNGRGNAQVTGPATHGSWSSNGGPVSEQYLRGQSARNVQAQIAEWHDMQTGTARFVKTKAGMVSAEHDPLAFLRAHGLSAFNANGEEVMPSASQARGLVGEYIRAMQREPGLAHPSASVSFRDPQMPANVALVHARSIFN